MFTKTHLIAALCLAGSAARALADDTEVDTRAFEYLDVIETVDGSIWKGVVVEQTPNVQYKIATADGSLHVIKAADVSKLTKQKNHDWRGTVATASATTTGQGLGTATNQASGSGPSGNGGPNGNGVAKSYDGGGGLPAPLATSGLRAELDFMTVIPQGDISSSQTSFSPNLRVGYEHLFGNFGLGGGGLARFTYWRLPSGEDPNDAAWTLETHAYVRAALHLSRFAIYGGASAGLDTNMIHLGMLNMSKTTEGFGVNLEAGAEVAASDNLAVTVGFDYHPGTDTIVDGAPQSISYLGVLAGAQLRL